MSLIDPDFIPVKPHGNWGDGGNDGCNIKTRHYYQIFAPLATTSVNPIEELNKAVVDYDKLLLKWNDVKGYSFVINDRFTGISALLLNNFTNFLKDKNIQEGKVIGAEALQQNFRSLTDSCKLDVLGMYSLDTQSDDFEPSVIGELIRHLIDNSEDSLTFLSGEAPDFDEKIIFNKINQQLGLRLKSNSHKVFVIEQFLNSQNDDGISQDLSKTINEIYKNLSKSIPSNELNKNELIYLGMKQALIPDFAKDNNISRLGYDSVAEIIIAKYFETCDVYEDPNNSNS